MGGGRRVNRQLAEEVLDRLDVIETLLSRLGHGFIDTHVKGATRVTVKLDELVSGETLANTFSGIAANWWPAQVYSHSDVSHQQDGNYQCLREEAREATRSGAYEKGGEWQLASDLLSTLAHDHCEKDTISHEAAISAYEKGGEWQLASDLRSTLAHDHSESDTISHEAAISAYEKGAEWQLASGVLSTVAHGQSVSDTISHEAAISACKKGGEWQLVSGVLSPRPNDIILYSRSMSVEDIRTAPIIIPAGATKEAHSISHNAASGKCDKGQESQPASGSSRMQDGMPAGETCLKGHGMIIRSAWNGLECHQCDDDILRKAWIMHCSFCKLSLCPNCFG